MRSRMTVPPADTRPRTRGLYSSVVSMHARNRFRAGDAQGAVAYPAYIARRILPLQ